MLEDVRLFYSELLKDFTTTGAIAPSSPLLAKAVIHPLKERPSVPIRVLEVGPGTGVFTHQILKQLRSGDVLDIYELNPRFCRFLRRTLRFSEYALCGIQCRLHQTDVRNLRKAVHYDFIISGLPLNNFDPQTVSEILETYLNHLAPEGVLSYFEYTLTEEFKLKFLKPSERERMARVGATVRDFVEKYQYSSNRVWWNLPPAKARHCRKTVA